MHLLRLLSRGNLAGANGPDRLVRNDNLAPVLDVALQALELLGDNLDSLSGLALLKGLTTAPDDGDAVLGGVLGLLGDDLVGLAQDCAALGVAENGPGDGQIGELGDGDLAGEGTVGLVVDVLGRGSDVVLDGVTNEREVDSRGSDDNL